MQYLCALTRSRVYFYVLEQDVWPHFILSMSRNIIWKSNWDLQECIIVVIKTIWQSFVLLRFFFLFHIIVPPFLNQMVCPFNGLILYEKSYWKLHGSIDSVVYILDFLHFFPTTHKKLLFWKLRKTIWLQSGSLEVKVEVGEIKTIWQNFCYVFSFCFMIVRSSFHF